MSEAPELPEDEALAAEHALGVLNASARAGAELRMARDSAFAGMVADWRQRLTPLLDHIEAIEPPADLWPRIERTLPANEDDGLAERVRMWRRTAMGAFALAAGGIAAAVVVLLQPPTVVTSPPASAPLLNASLSGQPGGQPLFVAAYDPDRKALIITSLVPPGADPAHVHELWIIPADGKPHSLGMIEPGTSKSMPMPGDMAPMMSEGSTLAISVEPPGGSPSKDAPSGPVAASGKLSKI